jgi:hypothetical protein
VNREGDSGMKDKTQHFENEKRGYALIFLAHSMNDEVVKIDGYFCSVGAHVHVPQFFVLHFTYVGILCRT